MYSLLDSVSDTVDSTVQLSAASIANYCLSCNSYSYHIGNQCGLDTSLAGCDIPVATGSGVGTAMSVLVEAAILALQAGVLLHEAPEVEWGIAMIALDGELDIFVAANGAGKRAAANQRCIYSEVSGEVSIVL